MQMYCFCTASLDFFFFFWVSISIGSRTAVCLSDCCNFGCNSFEQCMVIDKKIVRKRQTMCHLVNGIKTCNEWGVDAEVIALCNSKLSIVIDLLDSYNTYLPLPLLHCQVCEWQLRLRCIELDSCTLMLTNTAKWLHAHHTSFQHTCC